MYNAYDVAIIGGGLTGLSAAYHLAQAGIKTAVFEAGTIGSGASGRSGGQIHSGWRRDQLWLARKMGRQDAGRLRDLSQQAKALVLDMIRDHAIACDYTPGLILADHRKRFVNQTWHYVEYIRETYSYDALRPLTEGEIRALVISEDYHGGAYDAGGGHLDPLAFTQGLGRAAQQAGADIYEQTPVLRLISEVKPRLVLKSGEVKTDHVILAGDGMMGGLNSEIDAHILPIASYIARTEPLGEKLAMVLCDSAAVADSRFIVSYFRPDSKGRLIFGGGESYWPGLAADPERIIRPRLEKIFPQLKGVGFEQCWGGVLGITPSRLPYIRRVMPTVLAAGGFSGQGMALAPFAGKVMAEAVRGQLSHFDIMSHLPVPTFPGVRGLRMPLLALVMWWYALRDRL